MIMIATDKHIKINVITGTRRTVICDILLDLLPNSVIAVNRAMMIPIIIGFVPNTTFAASAAAFICTMLPVDSEEKIHNKAKKIARNEASFFFFIPFFI